MDKPLREMRFASDLDEFIIHRASDDESKAMEDAVKKSDQERLALEQDKSRPEASEGDE
jgi:hypothetical protein